MKGNSDELPHTKLQTILDMTLKLKKVKDWLKEPYSKNAKFCDEIGGSAWESNPPDSEEFYLLSGTYNRNKWLG
jgi:hypothetical protein